jgi:hypothetical protein
MNDDIGTTTASLLLLLHSSLRGEFEVALNNGFVILRCVNCKVNIKFSLCLINHHTMKAYGDGNRAPHVLNLDIRG